MCIILRATLPIPEIDLVMQLTRHTDYALRLLIALATADSVRLSVAEVAEEQKISRTHLLKIANALAHAGFIKAVRGRGGGVQLARVASEINLGAVIQASEPECCMIDCTACKLIRSCSLPRVLDEAKAAFQSVLAKYSLADIVSKGLPQSQAN